MRRCPSAPGIVNPLISGRRVDGRWRGVRDREGVIFISGKKILLIPEEELPKLLRSKPVTLAEYELDTPEKRSALERLFAMLERRKRPGK